MWPVWQDLVSDSIRTQTQTFFSPSTCYFLFCCPGQLRLLRKESNFPTLSRWLLRIKSKSGPGLFNGALYHQNTFPCWKQSQRGRMCISFYPTLKGSCMEKCTIRMFPMIFSGEWSHCLKSPCLWMFFWHIINSPKVDVLQPIFFLRPWRFRVYFHLMCHISGIGLPLPGLWF